MFEEWRVIFRRTSIAIVGWACFLGSMPSYAHEVIGISDGDTMTLLVGRKPLKIRLANIDAPEKAQAYGERSKQSLSDLCWGKDATYASQTVDRYGRTVAVVYCDNIEVNRAQVERGLAWVYEKYNQDASLNDLQKTARARQRGLWADRSPVPPWEFRRGSGGGQTCSSHCKR